MGGLYRRVNRAARSAFLAALKAVTSPSRIAASVGAGVSERRLARVVGGAGVEVGW